MQLTKTVLVNFDGSVVEFGERLNFNMVAVTRVDALASQVAVEILGHVLTEVVRVLCLNQSQFSFVLE